MASSKKYVSLPIKRKLEIIHLVENLPQNKKKKDIAAEFKIQDTAEYFKYNL